MTDYRNTIKRMVRRLRWKVRQWWELRKAPWPVVDECHSLYVAGHTCEQCHPTHSHEWAAWPEAPRYICSGVGIPVRCVHCGGRKCDLKQCVLIRHHDGDHEDERGFSLTLAMEAGTYE